MQLWQSVSFCLAGVVLCSASAFGQSVEPQPPPATDLKIPASVWAAGVIADQITTYRFTSQYRDLLHENNVLINALDRRPAWLVVAGSAIDATSGWLAYRFLGRRHPRIAAFAFYGAAAYRSYLAAHNLRMMERARQIRLGPQ